MIFGQPGSVQNAEKFESKTVAKSKTRSEKSRKTIVTPSEDSTPAAQEPVLPEHDAADKSSAAKSKTVVEDIEFETKTKTSE